MLDRNLANSGKNVWICIKGNRPANPMIFGPEGPPVQEQEMTAATTPVKRIR